MSRYAKPGQTIEDLKAIIEKDDGTPYEAVENSKVRSDLSKIEVDTENVDAIGLWDDPWVMPGTDSLKGYEMIGTGANAFPVLWCACGGDWELPLVFVLYIGNKGELRAYIPEDGNCYNKEKKSAYGNHDDDMDADDPNYRFDADKLRAAVADRILVKGEDGSAKGGEAPLTFRQVIQSLRDYDDQYASVQPHAKGAENPYWGIYDIWFENGVLNLGQTDDEGLTCDLIAERTEECIPEGLLDTTAVVRVGVTDKRNGKMDLLDVDGDVAVNHTVKSSEVKPCRGNDWFCKWILKFAK